MHKNNSLNRVTPEVYKQIIGISDSLPVMYKTHNKQVIFPIISKVITGKDVPEEKRTEKHDDNQKYVLKERKL